MKNNIIVDLDGTLADLTHRLHHIKTSPKNWDAFHAGCVNDAPIQNIIQLVNELWSVNEYIIHILSGRNIQAHSETVKWLVKHGVLYDTLTMRALRDFRDDTIVKAEMIEALGLTPDNTLFCLDDRQRVVDMWREKGFTCLQVNAWKE